MIVLDTNVISESMRPAPDLQVIDWINAQAIETLYLSTITVAELRYGVASLPKGKRRDKLSESLEKQVLPLFVGRMLAFDLLTTQTYSELMTNAKKNGHPIGTADGYIAAIVKTNGMIIATRDTSPFKAADVDTLNPWCC
ncbi:MAG: type II toxin-antitoxin system VapC family toxin [Cellvibrionaceae bacterium]|nr:type II toxin-antitoxin system VapC family toxin [Cellvibrionaceae bacterium]